MNDYARLLRGLSAGETRGSSDFELDLNRNIPPPAGRILRDAAVLIPVWLPPEGAARLILTRRAAHLQHHPGQIAFPGGKMDPADPTPIAAALREAHEEMGLLPSRVEVITHLPPHETISHFMVTPVIGVIRGDFTPVPQASEVAEVFDIPLAHAIDPNNFKIYARIWQGQTRRYYVLPYGPHYIWGATARILRSLAERVAAA